MRPHYMEQLCTLILKSLKSVSCCNINEVYFRVRPFMFYVGKNPPGDHEVLRLNCSCADFFKSSFVPPQDLVHIIFGCYMDTKIQIGKRRRKCLFLDKFFAIQNVYMTSIVFLTFAFLIHKNCRGTQLPN